MQIDPLLVQHDISWSAVTGATGPTFDNPGNPVYVMEAPYTPGPDTVPFATNSYFNVSVTSYQHE